MMTTYTFECNDHDEEDDTTMQTTMEIDSDMLTWNEVLGHFLRFLVSTGYSIDHDIMQKIQRVIEEDREEFLKTLKERNLMNKDADEEYIKEIIAAYNKFA